MYLHRTIAIVSVVTVVTTSILIWISIVEDDSMSGDLFESLRLGKDSILRNPSFEYRKSPESSFYLT